MSKSTSLAVLGFALALAAGAPFFPEPASAQYFYVANGENAGGSVAERAAVLGGTGITSIVKPQRVVARTQAFHEPTMHVYVDGTKHHADPDPRIVAQLERDCPVEHY